MLGSTQRPHNQHSHALLIDLMEKYIVDTQGHQIVYVAYFGYNNQWKIDNAPNDII